jgi:glycerate kinase
MSHILIAPDKFKGSLTSFEACKAITDGIRTAGITTPIIQLPMADGGDGFAAIMKHYGKTQTIECNTCDPLGRPIQASYEIDTKNSTAIIEMASASGLVLLKDHERNANKTSTFGTGLLIRDAVQRGIHKILLGLGGSATNDAGTGILQALGFRFNDKNESPIPANGENLQLITRIIPPPNPITIHFELACDVQNTLYGPQGAAYIYGPQKGASPNDIIALDNGLRNIAALIHNTTGKDIALTPGTGAAGGIAAGLMAFYDVRITSGVDLVLNASNISALLPNTTLLITGEGKIDAQTQEGKVVARLTDLAQLANIPVIAFCGIADPNTTLTAEILVITPADMDKNRALANAATLLTQKSKDYFTRAAGR